MAKISSASRFVPANRMLSLSGALRIGEAFKALDRAKAGGLVVTAAGIPKLYVPIRALAAALLDEVPHAGWPALADATLDRIIDDALERTPFPGGTYGGSVLEQTEEATLPQPRRTFFAVVDAARAHIGWYLTEDELRRTIDAAPVAFLCTNHHRNPEPNGGRCRECGAAIVALA